MSEKDRNEETNQAGEGDGLKVTDRRLFTLDGELREELPEVEEPTPQPEPETTKEEVEEPRAESKEAAGFEHRPLDEPEGVDFTMLINAMAQPALIFLGEIAHPGTGQPEVNLEQARLQIDLLDLLRIKCRGNLTADEDSLLDRMLYQLRMIYVARSGAPGPQPGS